MTLFRQVLVLWFALNLISCASAIPDLYPPLKTGPGPGRAIKNIYVLSHGWHTGLVIKRADIPDDLWPEKNDLGDYEYLEIGWGDEGFYKSYLRQDKLKAESVGYGNYGDSRFYKARGKYYFPKTCNVWTAKALRKAGCPITSFYAITSGNTMHQVGKFGRVIRK